jgi:hypothetical protein
MRRARDGRWATRFGGWVGEVSVARISQGVGVTNKAVYGWLAGVTTPRANRAMELVRLSRGRLSLEDVFRHGAEVRGTRGEP